MTTGVIEMRCAENPARLFAKVLGTKPLIVEGNLIEFSCRDCRRDHHKRGDMVVKVLHRFNIAGECVESEVVR